MHGAILVMTHHGGHFPYSAIPSSAFPYSVFRIPRFTNSHYCFVCTSEQAMETAMALAKYCSQQAKYLKRCEQACIQL